MNIYWLNPPFSTRALNCDLAYINFSFLFCQHNWIRPIIDWDQYTNIEQILNHVLAQPVDVLMISCYAWNIRLCHAVAQQVREINPDIVIVAGGPQQTQPESFVDYLCYAMGHGEQFLQNLLPQLQQHGKVVDPDSVPFLITSNYKSPVTTQRYEFPTASAYEYNQAWISEVVTTARQLNKTVTLSLETARGCPYACTYCEWGGGIGTKISQKPMSVIERDIEVASLLGVEELDIIDANFGILPRDVDVADCIAAAKKTYGYPHRVAVYGLAKTRVDRREAILDRLFEGQLIEFYFMAIQTANPDVLVNVRRTDIDLEQNLRLAAKYKQQYNSQAKVEIIMGLPGYTLDDFYHEMLLFQQTGNWFCPRNLFSLLPNTEAASAAYRAQYQLKTAWMGSWENDEQDVTRVSHNVISQYRSAYEIVVESCSFSLQDWKQMFFMNRAQRVLGPLIQGPADTELRKCFAEIQTQSWYAAIDQWLSRMVSNQLVTEDINLINGQTIEEIVADHTHKLTTLAQRT